MVISTSLWATVSHQGSCQGQFMRVLMHLNSKPNSSSCVYQGQHSTLLNLRILICKVGITETIYFTEGFVNFKNLPIGGWKRTCCSCRRLRSETKYPPWVAWNSSYKRTTHSGLRGHHFQTQPHAHTNQSSFKPQTVSQEATADRNDDEDPEKGHYGSIEDNIMMGSKWPMSRLGGVVQGWGAGQG